MRRVHVPSCPALPWWIIRNRHALKVAQVQGTRVTGGGGPSVSRAARLLRSDAVPCRCATVPESDRHFLLNPALNGERGIQFARK